MSTRLMSKPFKPLFSLLLIWPIFALQQLEAQLICPDNLTSYWPLDETSGGVFQDAVGTNNLICPTSCPAPSRGLIGGGQSFDGTAEVSAAVDPSFQWGNADSFTLEAWFLSDGPKSVEILMGRTDDLIGGFQIWIGLDRGRPRFFLRDTNDGVPDEDGDLDTVSLSATRIPQANQWHHVVGVRDAEANQALLYVDGTLAASSDQAIFDGNFSSPTATLNVGWIQSVEGFKFVGTLDELAVYGRALNANEISTHFRDGLEGLALCQSPLPPAILSSPITEAFSGEVYEYPVKALGVPTPTLALIESPEGMEIDEVGLISWVPLEAQEGSHAVAVEASNSEGSARQDFTVEVQVPLGCFGNTVSYWALDEMGERVFEDFLGLNDAFCDNCPAPAAGLVEGGQRFDGQSTVVTVPPDPSFDFANNDSFTLEVWFNTINFSDLEVYFGRAEELDLGMQVWVGHSAEGLPIFVVRDANSNTVAVEARGSVPIIARWHHLVGVRNAETNEVLLYVDGQLKGGPVNTAESFDGDFSSPTANLELGSLLSSFHYSGRLDEVAIYKRALTPKEVSDHYNDGIAGQPLCTTTFACPEIFSQPQDQEICENETTTLSVFAAGAEPLGFQWRKDGIKITGETNDELEISEATPGDSGNYDVVITNECGSLTSDIAVLVVKPGEECVPMFRRGDDDANGELTIGDPIANLAFQFGGAGEPTCKDALDYNDDGQIDLSDPVANLAHQFLGGNPPAPPGLAQCGSDPTDDIGGVDLGCENYPEDKC